MDEGLFYLFAMLPSHVNSATYFGRNPTEFSRRYWKRRSSYTRAGVSRKRCILPGEGLFTVVSYGVSNRRELNFRHVRACITYC